MSLVEIFGNLSTNHQIVVLQQLSVSITRLGCDLEGDV
jgi:hypothetical protein